MDQDNNHSHNHREDESPEDIQERIAYQQFQSGYIVEIQEEEYNKAKRLVVAPKNRDGYITIVDRDEHGKPIKKMVLPDANKGGSLETLNKLRKDRYYIVDKLLKAKCVHMLAGPSGVNKTTWLLPLIHDWSLGKEVLGFQSNPTTYLYISCDRSQDGVAEVLERIGLQDWDIRCESLGSIRKKLGLSSSHKLDIKDLTELFPDVKVFFIEGIGMLKGSSKNPNDYVENMQYWAEIGHLCEDRDVTIIGVVHCSKSKPGEKYDNPRDRIIGSVSLPATTETLFIMDFDESKDVSNKGRKLFVIPRNLAPFTKRYKLDNKGGLVELTEEEFQEQEQHVKVTKQQENLVSSKKMMVLDSFLANLKPNATFEMEDVVRYAAVQESVKISLAHIYRWKDAKIESHEIEVLKDGYKTIFIRKRIN